MFIFSNLISASAYVLRYVIQILNFLILIRVVLSWVNADPYNGLVRAIFAVTEPVLAPFRKIIPVYRIGIDFSPILAFLALMFVDQFLVKTLFDLAYRLR